MAAEVGAAYVSVIPSARTFGTQLKKQTSPALTKFGKEAGTGITRDINGKLRDAQGKFVTDGGKSGKAMGKKFGSAFGFGLKGVGLGSIGGALGIGLLAKSAIGAEASFSQTMNTLAAVTKTPQREIKVLSDLALKFGRDTIFSAGEAASAMLELAKGGLTTAQIRGGALSETLTLAAASGEDLATSATILSNAMHTFGLSAKDAPQITAALAGAANASTASIGSLGEALQQVGPGAKNAGLSVQETVAALAAFDNAGIKGSDAGTSLKTMLARLVPPTKKAQKAADALGLSFTKQNGAFLPLPKIAGRLQRAFKGLSQEQRTTRLNQIFGSDATRAASVLTDQGEKGIRKYIKATKDQGAAQRIAAARMAGTSGALETLKGSFETAKLSIGQAIAPAVQAGAGLATRALNGLAQQVPILVARIRNPFGTFQTEILPRLRALGTFVKTQLAPALLKFAQTVVPAMLELGRSIGQAIGSVINAFTGGNKSASDFGTTLITILPAIAQASATYFRIIALAVRTTASLFRILTFNIRLLGTIGTAIIRTFGGTILNVFGFIVNAAAKAFGWVPGLGPKLKQAAAKFAIFKTQVKAALAGFGALGFKVGEDFRRNLTAAIAGNGKVAGVTARNTANKLAANTALLGVRANSQKSGASTTTNITVNNPVPEPASETVPKALRRKLHRQGVPAT